MDTVPCAKTASDGTMWLKGTPSSLDDGWTGWVPGEDGVWFMSDIEMQKYYPEILH